MVKENKGKMKKRLAKEPQSDSDVLNSFSGLPEKMKSEEDEQPKSMTARILKLLREKGRPA